MSRLTTRLQADEAYQVGKGLTPVAAYLAQDDIIRIALEHGVDMIHPGCVHSTQVYTYLPLSKVLIREHLSLFDLLLVFPVHGS